MSFFCFHAFYSSMNFFVYVYVGMCNKKALQAVASHLTLTVGTTPDFLQEQCILPTAESILQAPKWSSETVKCLHQAKYQILVSLSTCLKYTLLAIYKHAALLFTMVTRLCSCSLGHIPVHLELCRLWLASPTTHVQPLLTSKPPCASKMLNCDCTCACSLAVSAMGRAEETAVTLQSLQSLIPTFQCKSCWCHLVLMWMVCFLVKQRQHWFCYW